MSENFSFRSLKAQTVQNKFNIIVGLVVFILMLGLVETLASVKVMSGIRAYVGGEGLWSKGQKEALNSLVSYAFSLDEADYQKYQQFMQVPLGDHQARLEMNKKNPDYARVTEGFVQGGNNPGDVGDLFFLYRNFRNNRLMKPAIDAWVQGDEQIQNLITTGNQIHELIAEGMPAAPAARNVWMAKRVELVASARVTDARLTVLEDRFSASLGEGSRRIERFLFQVTIFSTALLGALTLVVAIRSARTIIRLDRLKTEFVSLASHQLRTPLTAINWYAESLLSETAGTLNPKQKQYISELYGGGQRMASLISDLLKVSSLDLGTYRPDISPVDISRTLSPIVHDLQPQIDQKHIELDVSIDPQVPVMNADKHFLTAVLQNLVSNSVKYTRKNGRITVHVTKQRQNIIIQVSDNGMGIPEEQQAQIFKKLFRADNAQKLDPNGTGLGLYIVRSMVRHMGGKVWFRSVENKGTDFFVKLPVRSRYHMAKQKDGDMHG